MRKSKSKVYEFLIKFFKPTKSKVIITLAFIFTASLSLFGIEPFAYYKSVGDRVMAKPSILVTGPLYPLIWITENILDKTSIEIDLGTGNILLGVVLMFILVIIYYYILSCLLVLIFKNLKIKQK